MKHLFFIGGVIIVGLFFANGRRPAKIVETGSSIPVYCGPSIDTALMNNGDAPIFSGLGNLHFAVTTTSARVQRYFNQGLSLMYAFNHGEAGRSFKSALKLDSTCAMVHWGMVMVLGPNYNAALNPISLAEINAYLDKAKFYAKDANEKEKGLIAAVAKRYPSEPATDMSPFNEAYATAMKKLAIRFPDDMEIAVLYAEALMNEHPWNLWLKDGTPQPWTPAILNLLEEILGKWPSHPGAIHYYIHATEASKNAEKALPYAGRLPELMPAAGHLVHMPSHIYIRTGDYHKGVLVNERASSADSAYISQCRREGSYPMLLYPHNIHFLAACAFLEGSSEKAIRNAWRVSAVTDKRYLAENITLQHYYIIPYYVLVQLGRWKDILALSAPGESLLYPRSIYHYARGMAFAASNELPAAERELELLKIIAGDAALKKMLIWDMNSAADLAGIASNVLEGEILARRRRFDAADKLFVAATDIEDRLNYTEPPDWFFSVRLTRGHWLLKAQKYAGAEKIFRDDLQTFKENGWSLMGLYKALAGQKKDVEAAEVSRRFNVAWQWADISISSSRVE